MKWEEMRLPKKVNMLKKVAECHLPLKPRSRLVPNPTKVRCRVLGLVPNPKRVQVELLDAPSCGKRLFISPRCIDA